MDGKGLPLGVVNLDAIPLDLVSISKALSHFLAPGSRIHVVSAKDLNLEVQSAVGDYKTAKVMELVDKGMKFFDAVAYVCIPADKRPPPVINANMDLKKLPSHSALARALFYVFFFLLTQARYPGQGGEAQQSQVPAFLKTIMGMKEPQKYYVDLLASFAMEKFDPSWIRHVKFANFSRESLTRFGLGVAGYRMLAAFKHYNPRPDCDQAVKDAVAWCVAVARAPACWEIHPITREPALLTKYGNLNKNCTNLLLQAYDEATLQKLVDAKCIYAMPVEVPGYDDWKRWNVEDLPEMKNLVFPSS